jgi:tRNA threonylcarbamoyladenosine biosynthesis protein TsaE
MPASGGAPESVAEEDMRILADRLWRELAPGSVVWLRGDLGTGKTTFAQAMTAAAGAVMARSPSFALVHEYDCPEGVIAHVDCYRLREPTEAIDLDFPGLAHRARLLLVEWPEKAGGFVPEPDAHLVFAHTDDPHRRLVERVA